MASAITRGNPQITVSPPVGNALSVAAFKLSLSQELPEKKQFVLEMLLYAAGYFETKQRY